MPKIYPVIHYQNLELALDQALLARQAGCAGVFLCSHSGDDAGVLEAALGIKGQRSSSGDPWEAYFTVGINLLSTQAVEALRITVKNQIDAVWIDAPGITSQGLDVTGDALSQAYKKIPIEQRPLVFAGVAFKYQAHEPDPASAAAAARAQGFIPTTSGDATGSAPSVQKIVEMAISPGGSQLAIASGMTPENIGQFKPHLSHILVATGIARDFHRMCPDKLRAFMAEVATV